MKKVNFIRIKIKNFLSFGEDPVEVEFKTGLNIITGVNRDKDDRQNGLGKSSLMESLYFAIFGATIRELKKDLIPNTYTNGTCMVDLDFEVVSSTSKDSYEIKRTINPTKLHLYKNGVDVTRDSMKNTEEDIHNILNASTSVFQNCVIMTANETIPFMSKSKVEKRKFIEAIFNLDIFSKMLSDAREDYNATKRLYEIELTKMEDANRTLSTLKKQKENILSSRLDKVKVYEKRKVDNLNEIQKLQDLIKSEDTLDITKIKDDLNKFEKAVDTLDKNHLKLRDKVNTLNTQISINEKTLKKFSLKNASCPTCKRPLEEHDKETTDNEIANLKSEIQTDSDNVSRLNSEIKELLEKKTKISSIINKNNKSINEYNLLQQRKANTDDRIKQLNQWLSTLDEDIDALKDSKTDVDSVIESQEVILASVKEEVQKNRNHMNMLDTAKYIVSEEGVKSYIVKQILELFNTKLSFYLNKLDSNCICQFNEYFEEQILNENRKLCSYNNFSSSEKRTIDLAIMFTFLDIRKLQGNITYNISFFDELFDSAFDEKGLRLIKEILNDRVDKNNECIMVITHRSENIKSVSGEVVYLEKKDGITKRIDYKN